MAASSGTVCVPNIGPIEIRKRRAIGFGVLALTVAALGAMVMGGAPLLTRLILAPFWWLGVLGVVQAHQKTCVALAAQGVRNMDDGPEPVRDPQQQDVIQVQARRVRLWSLLAAVLLTLLSLLPYVPAV